MKPRESRVALLSRLAVAMALATALGGCVALSPDAGMAPVAAVALARLDTPVARIESEAEAADAEVRVARLLKRPLRVDTAVAIAFLRNKGLQADFNDLGVAEADYVKASLPPDPRLTVDFLAGQGDLEVVSQVVAAVYALATLPARQAIAKAYFTATQTRIAGQVMALAADVSRQYYIALAAAEQTAFLDTAVMTAEAAAVVARQLGEAGNLNKLEQAREDVFYAEIVAQRGDARLAAQAEREKLTRLLGLWGPDIAYTLPKALPPLPNRIATARDVEATAIRERLDLAAARRDLDALARQLGLTIVTRYVSDFTLTYKNDRETSGSGGGSNLGTETRRSLTRNGFVGELTIPIYDFGESKVRGAREAYLGAANRLVQRAIDARSEAREAFTRYRGKYDLARFYADRILPLRAIILSETGRQTNGMLADVTQLLVDARGRIVSNVAAIAARRDFFLAGVDLQAALFGNGPASAGVPPAIAQTAN